MNVTYRSYRVITKPRLSPDADCWVPVAEIFWDEQGSPQHQLLSGVREGFKSIDDAELEAFELAMNWIDAQFAIPLSAKLVA